MLSADVAIVGAGPVGLFAIFACGQLGMRTIVIDALTEVGGQCTALYPQKPIYDIPTRASVQAEELIGHLMEQALPYAPVIITGETVTGLEQERSGRFRLTTSEGRTVDARAVILAIGAGAFVPNRPPLAGIELHENKGVFYSVRDTEMFRERRVTIAGGGDSALDWAVALAPIAASVTLVHRRSEFRAAPASVQELTQLMEAGRITLKAPFQLDALIGEPGALTALRLARIGGGTEDVETDYLLAFFGLATDLGPAIGWEIGAERKAIPVEPATCATSRPGIHAIGDVAAYSGKRKLILTGFSEACAAAYAIYAEHFPEASLHSQYSTTRGAPGFPSHSPIA